VENLPPGSYYIKGLYIQENVGAVYEYRILKKDQDSLVITEMISQEQDSLVSNT
jgi:hypothetical protein